MGRLWLQGQTPVHDTTNGSAQEIGTAFVPLADGQVEAILYYRTSGATANTAFRLWEADNSTALASQTLSSGAQTDQGWQTCTLTTPVPITAGRTYIVSVTWVAGAGEKYDNPISPFNGGEFQRYFECFNATPGSLPTGSGYQGEVRAVDVLASFQTQPVTPTDLDNALAGWLSTTDGTHGDSAPLQDHTTLATVNTNTGAVKSTIDDLTSGLAGAAHGYYADVQAAIGLIKTVTDTLPTPIARLSSIVLDHYTADIAGILAQIDAVATGQTAPNADIKRLGGSVFLPASGWTLADETDFTDEIAWGVAGDLYVVTVTAVPTGVAPDSFAGVTWYHRLGSWAPLNGDQIAGARQFLEFTPQELHDGGRRMPGVAIHCKTGTLGHVQAWLLA
jgi:uncharacterized protein DUF4082